MAGGFLERLVDAGTMTLGEATGPPPAAPGGLPAPGADEVAAAAEAAPPTWGRPPGAPGPPPAAPVDRPPPTPAGAAPQDGRSPEPDRGPEAGAPSAHAAPRDAPQPTGDGRPAAPRQRPAAVPAPWEPGPEPEAAPPSRSAIPPDPAEPAARRELRAPAPRRRPDVPAGTPPAPLRDAGIRSVTPVAGTPTGGVEPVGQRGPDGIAAHPPAAPDERERLGERSVDLLADDWRDLGRRLLAAHPPEAPAGAASDRPLPSPAAPGPPAGVQPELLIEHLEVRLLAGPPAVEPEPRERPARHHAPRAWDAAVRHYLGRT